MPPTVAEPSVAESGGGEHHATTTRMAVMEIRATLLSGLWLGALVGGIGGRLAMLVLRVTSPDSVHGVISDDGFFIGKVTLEGTYSLIGIGAGIGVIGAVAYRLVDHWLIGPGWFRQFTSALGAGAVVGSMLVHTDGVDFRVLQPLGLAIAFFVLIPAVFGFFIGPMQRALSRPEAWVNQGRGGWVLAAVSLLAFPPLLPVVAAASVVMLVGAIIRTGRAYELVRDNQVVGMVVRGAWLAFAVLGAVTLVRESVTILS